MSAGRQRQAVITLVHRLALRPDVQIVSASHDLFAAAWDLYTRRPDKEWSLTDCTSFVVMQRHGLTDALTGDHHFEQAGFTVLFK
jgi:predicted nucleic acid-binding protein